MGWDIVSGVAASVVCIEEPPALWGTQRSCRGAPCHEDGAPRRRAIDPVSVLPGLLTHGRLATLAGRASLAVARPSWLLAPPGNVQQDRRPHSIRSPLLADPRPFLVVGKLRQVG